MKNKKIPVFDIKLGTKEKNFVNDCLDTSFIGQGPYVKDFEKKFSTFVNCEYGITTTSGTTALHLACKTLGIEEGDQVLVSSSTNMACAFAVDYCGAIPIPIDIEKETNLSIKLNERSIWKVYPKIYFFTQCTRDIFHN